MTKCPYGSKGNYVKEEDCHCFCCGTHDGKKNKEVEDETLTQT